MTQLFSTPLPNDTKPQDFVLDFRNETDWSRLGLKATANNTIMQPMAVTGGHAQNDRIRLWHDPTYGMMIDEQSGNSWTDMVQFTGLPIYRRFRPTFEIVFANVDQGGSVASQGTGIGMFGIVPTYADLQSGSYTRMPICKYLSGTQLYWHYGTSGTQTTQNLMYGPANGRITVPYGEAVKGVFTNLGAFGEPISDTIVDYTVTGPELFEAQSEIITNEGTERRGLISNKPRANGPVVFPAFTPLRSRGRYQLAVLGMKVTYHANH